MKIPRSVFALGLLALVALPYSADAQLTRSGSPEVSFTATGTLGFSMVGKTSELNVSDSAQAITVAVDTTALSTGIGVRDTHMKNYLEVDKFKATSLSVSKSALKIPAAGQTTSGDADGTLSLHGQTHPVKFHYTAKRDGNKFAVDGTMNVNMNDFGIVVKSYLGITVKPKVDINVHFDAVDK
jgi:polyisoprenoid-binding protein YceI